MRRINFLKNITFLEIVLNTILALLFFTGIVTNFFELSGSVMVGAGILHITSMILHWLAWNQLPVTHKDRIAFNFWVIGSFALTLIGFAIYPPFGFIMLFVLLMFAAMWFVYYCIILFREYSYLKRRKELYDQRELIHF